MSGMGNPYVNLAPGPSPVDYQLQQQQILRQQRLADALRQQAADPIQVQSSNGTPAPISWLSILAKGLQGVGAGMKERGTQDQMAKLGQQDQDSAQALIQALTRKTNQVGAPGMADSSTQVDATAPQLPGGPAPMQRMADVGVPGQQAQGAQQTAQAPQDQLAAILAARGGPQTQMIQQAMLPQVFAQQNAERQQAMQRDERLWEQNLGLSEADKQRAAIQLKNQEDLAQFQNRQPMTAAQQAANAVALGTLNETKRYHNQMSGAGLTEDGSPNPVVSSWRDQIARGNATLQNVPMPLRSAVSLAINATPKEVYTPLAGQRFTLESSRITHPYTNMAAYKLTADGLPYLQRIDAALKHPGSVSDQDLLDSLTKLNTGGNAVTEAQVNLITGHGSYADWANTMANKFKNGGSLSDNQRQQIKSIANDIYANYRKGYQPVYEEAVGKLKQAGVPEAFWTIPDLNKLNAGQMVGSGTPGGPAPKGVPAPPPGFVVH